MVHRRWSLVVRHLQHQRCCAQHAAPVTQLRQPDRRLMVGRHGAPVDLSLDVRFEQGHAFGNAAADAGPDRDVDKMLAAAPTPIT